MHSRLHENCSKCLEEFVFEHVLCNCKKCWGKRNIDINSFDLKTTESEKVRFGNGSRTHQLRKVCFWNYALQSEVISDLPIVVECKHYLSCIYHGKHHLSCPCYYPAKWRLRSCVRVFRTPKMCIQLPHIFCLVFSGALLKQLYTDCSWSFLSCLLRWTVVTLFACKLI